MPPVVPGPSLIAIHEGITDVREALGRVQIADSEVGSSARERQLQQEAAWAELRSVSVSRSATRGCRRWKVQGRVHSHPTHRLLNTIASQGHQPTRQPPAILRPPAATAQQPRVVQPPPQARGAEPLLKRPPRLPLPILPAPQPATRGPERQPLGDPARLPFPSPTTRPPSPVQPHQGPARPPRPPRCAAHPPHLPCIMHSPLRFPTSRPIQLNQLPRLLSCTPPKQITAELHVLDARDNLLAEYLPPRLASPQEGLPCLQELSLQVGTFFLMDEWSEGAHPV